MKFFSDVWEDIEEILYHVTGSFIVIIVLALYYKIITSVVSFLFSEENYFISIVNLSAHGVVIILFLIYLYKSVKKATSK